MINQNCSDVMLDKILENTLISSINRDKSALNIAMIVE